MIAGDGVTISAIGKCAICTGSLPGARMLDSLMRLRSAPAFWSIVDKLIMGASIGFIALAAWASLR